MSLASLGACISIGFVLHRFVRGQLDGRLDARIMALALELRPGPDGGIAVQGDREVPPFDRPRSSWYWEVHQRDAVIGSASLEGAHLVLPEPRPRLIRTGKFIPADGEGPSGERLILRLLTVPGPPTLFAAWTQSVALYGPVLEALRTLSTGPRAGRRAGAGPPWAAAAVPVERATH